MKTVAKIINENTPFTFSVGFIITAIGFLFAVVVWGKNLEDRVNTRFYGDDIITERQSHDIEEMRQVFKNIDQRLSRIEGALGAKGNR